MPDEPPFRLPPVEPDAAVPVSSLTPELLASLLVEGDDVLAAWTLEHALAERPRAEVFDRLLGPAMGLVGERWQTGQWGVSEEHRASQTVLRALDRVRPPDRAEAWVGPLAVLAGVAGEQHMIGLVCLAQILAEAGWSVATLGADVPTEDLARFLARNEAALVALTASDGTRLEALVDAIAAARAARPGIRVMVGGRIAGRPDLASTLGVDWAGTSLMAAAAAASALVPASRAGDT
jgi:methanogenic corrinoid protein MtbC1